MVCCGYLTGILGLLGVLSGALTFTFYDDLYDFILEKSMVLAPDSMSYDMWETLPMPMYMKVYYYNCTNHEDVQKSKEKPLLKQLGPYVFREYHQKTNVTFQDNQTVTFFQKKEWFFEPDMSNGTLDDILYTLNVIAVTAAESTRWPFSLTPDDYPFLRITMNSTFHTTGEQLFMKTNIRDITFDGINSPLLTMLDDGPMDGAVEMPFDKFGWFYERNGSETYDGMFEMWTGEGNLQKVGQITKWQGEKNISRFFPSPCSDLSGSAGEFFPPNRDKTAISFFSPDLCRTIFFNFKEETTHHGIPGYKYWLDTGFIANATYNASNTCYNPHPDLVQQPRNDFGEELPGIKPLEGAVDIGLYNGLLNVSSCKFNAPAYISFPHFFNADPELLKPFHEDSDLHPNEAEHESYLTLMPRSGIPLDVSIRMQINILVRPLQFIKLLEGVDTMFYPMIWFETTTVLEDDLVSQLKMLNFASKIGNIAGGVSLGVGAVLTVLGVFLVFRHRSHGFSQFV